MSDFFIYYTESNIVCIVIFGIMLFRDLFSSDRQEKQIKYDHALIAFMLYFASDSIWAAVDAGVFPKTMLSVSIVNFSNYILMAAVTYMWLRYVMAVEQAPNRDKKINKFAVLFPFIVVTVAYVVISIFFPHLLINENLEATPLYHVLQISVPDIYIMAVLVYTMSRAKTEINPQEKRRHLYIGLFPVSVVLCGLVEILLLPNTPVFCFSCTILMLIFYIQSMEQQISMDPLTRLNNRAQLLRYVSQEANTRGRKTFVIMIDVNDFKGINDNYGHSEGDRALVLIADALKDVTKNHSMPSFLGRYGGDEFIIIAHPANEAELAPLIKEIREKIDQKNREANAPYTVSVGIGCDEFLGGQDTFQKCLQRADHKLYLDKEYMKLGGQASESK